jgi:vitamin-K-epoxide reductase (warfarin-sensitive)
MNLLIVLISFIGFCISLYAYSVEATLKKDPTYKPFCNISDRISCTKPIESPYGKLMGFSNSVLGMVYYPIMALLGIIGNTISLFVLATGSLLFTLYLAFILLVKIRSLCLICLSIYAVNTLMFLVALQGMMH